MLLSLLVLVVVLAFTAVFGLSFPFLLTSLYTAFFIFFGVLSNQYDLIQFIDIDYTHIVLLQIASSFALVYFVIEFDKSGNAFVFSSLQCLSVFVNIFILLCYIYASQVVYSAARDYYMTFNDSLLYADLLALVGCAYGDFRRNSDILS